MKKNIFLTTMAVLLALLLASCATTQESNTVLDFDNSAWQYNAEDDVYWQAGVQYVARPASLTYETLGIYVPGAYFNAVANGDGTYTVTLNKDAVINGYTAETAPVVMPVNTPGYAAQTAPTGYTSGLDAYMEAGFIYVVAGCRGRENMMKLIPGGEIPEDIPEQMKEDIARLSEASEGEDVTGSAPWAVTDLKAAVRYLRYNSDVLPGDEEKIITFGMSGGGAQSSLMGITGNSDLYTPYLEEIGAAMTDKDGKALSDAVYGAMAWCPITSLDWADAAYEWNLGQYVTTGTREEGTLTKAISDDLAAAYAGYINSLGLTAPDGTVLTLEDDNEGIYTSGSYYDFMVSVLENSLNNFLEDTVFPYTPDNSMQAGFAGNAGGNDGFSMKSTSTEVYETAADYIDYLNEESEWVVYDAKTNTARITSLDGFVNLCKKATKDVGAFDALDRSAGENEVFGDDSNTPLHFDSALYEVLKENAGKYSAYSEWDEALLSEFESDLAYVNAEGSMVQERVDMYNPMYYISPAYAGYGTSDVAPYIRIRTGLFQGDTSVNVELNMALALEALGNTEVDFETVWGLYHTTAERTGTATDNFISWVEEITR